MRAMRRTGKGPGSAAALALALALAAAPGLGASFLCATEPRCEQGLCADELGRCVSPSVAANETILAMYWGDTEQVLLEAFDRGARTKSIDVVFAVDFTASMRDDLEQFIRDWDAIIENMAAKVDGRLRVALVPFQDRLGDRLTPAGGGAPVRIISQFRDLEAAREANSQYLKDLLLLVKANAAGGGDCRESSYEAVRYAVEEDWSKDYEFGSVPGACDGGACRWRSGALKLVFVITDAAVFTGHYDEMSSLATAASASGIVVFGLTPNPTSASDTSPCPPTCPPCTRAGGTCSLRCVGEGTGQLCESSCCGGHPSWKGFTGQGCDMSSPAACSGLAWAPDTEHEAFQYCYDLVNLTRDTRGRYYGPGHDGFDLAALSRTIGRALDEIDHDTFTVSVHGPAELHAGILGPTGKPVPSVTLVLQGSPGEACTPVLPQVPCSERRRLELSAPQGTPVGWYNLTVASTSDRGARGSHDVKVRVKAPVDVAVDYLPALVAGRLLVFVNVTNRSPVAVAPLRGRTEVWCDALKAAVLWEEGAGEIPPSRTATLVADCQAAARTSKGIAIAIADVQPPAIADREVERVNVTFTLRDPLGKAIPFMENEYLYSVRFNRVELANKGVAYDLATGRYLLTADVPSGTAKDGYNLLEVAIEDAGRASSDARFVRWGNQRLEVSALVPFGDDAREQVDRTASLKVRSVLASPLDAGARALFVHQDLNRGGVVRRAGPELAINYTAGQGFLLLQGFERASGRMDVVLNRTGILPGSLVRTYDARFLAAHDLYLTVRTAGSVGGARLEPAYLVAYGALEVPGVGVQRREEGWRRGDYVLGLHYNNLTLRSEDMVPFSISVPENATALQLNVSSPALGAARSLKLDRQRVEEKGLAVNVTPLAGGVGSLVALRLLAAGSGELWVNLTTGHRDVLSMRVPFAVTDPFRLSAPQNITVVPNKTGELGLGFSNLMFEGGTFRFCGSGRGVRARVSGVEVTAPAARGRPACHEAAVEGGSSVTLNVTVTLLDEAGGELVLNATSASDPRQTRSVRVAVLPSLFTSSVIQLKDCEKNEWTLRCAFEFNNGGNVRTTYRFGFAPDLLVVKPPFDTVEVDKKDSKSLYLDATLIGCSIDPDVRPRLTSLGRLFFLGRLFAEYGNYSSSGPLADLFADADAVSRMDDLGVPAESGALKAAIASFRSSPSSGTGAALAKAVESFYTAYFEAIRSSCTLSKARDIVVTAYACDAPMRLGDELRYACVNRTFRATNIRINLAYDLEPDASLAAALQQKGSLHVLANGKASLAMVLRNRLHFPLLFDFVASASFADKPLAEESNVLIEEGKERRFPVELTWGQSGSHMLYLKGSPSGYPEERRSVSVALEVDAEASYGLDLSAPPQAALPVGRAAELVATLTNLGNSEGTFVVSVSDPAGVCSQPSPSRPLVPAGGLANVTVTATPKERGRHACNLTVAHGEKAELSRTVALAILAQAPEIVVKVPDSIQANATVRISNLGDANGTVSLSLGEGSSRCASLSNTSVEVPAGGEVEVALTNACGGLASLELIVEGAGYSRSHPIPISASPTPEPSALASEPPPPAPTPEPEGGGARAAVVVVVSIAAVALAAMKARARRKPQAQRPAAAAPFYGRRPALGQAQPQRYPPQRFQYPQRR